MATMFTDLLTIGGTHDISNVLTIWAKPLANGSVATVDLDNGACRRAGCNYCRCPSRGDRCGRSRRWWKDLRSGWSLSVCRPR